MLHDLNVALQYGDAFFLLDGGRIALETDDSTAIRATCSSVCSAYAPTGQRTPRRARRSGASGSDAAPPHAA